MPRADRGMGRGGRRGHQHLGTTDPRLMDQAAVADERRADGRLASDDRSDVERAGRDEPGPGDGSNREGVTGITGGDPKNPRKRIGPRR